MALASSITTSNNNITTSSYYTNSNISNIKRNSNISNNSNYNSNNMALAHWRLSFAHGNVGCGQIIVGIIIIIIIVIILIIISSTIIVIKSLVVVWAKRARQPAGPDLGWLRINGANTPGVAAKVLNSDRLGTKVRPGTSGKIKAG